MNKKSFLVDKIGDTLIYVHKSIRIGSVFIYNGRKIKILRISNHGAEFTYWEEATCKDCNHTTGRYSNVPYTIMASEFNELTKSTK